MYVSGKECQTSTLYSWDKYCPGTGLVNPDFVSDIAAAAAAAAAAEMEQVIAKQLEAA